MHGRQEWRRCQLQLLLTFNTKVPYFTINSNFTWTTRNLRYVLNAKLLMTT